MLKSIDLGILAIYDWSYWSTSLVNAKKNFIVGGDLLNFVYFRSIRLGIRNFFCCLNSY
jgi:hypothetical protein